ncbi:MAG: hypothetical protein N2Z63_08330 [Thiobacillaceae bacterium]|nr:hypothetical protein [Thiobacillaceae bacterium]
MDLATLEALRSPAGVPSHPAIFLALGVVTWALHIMAVHVTLGSLLLSLIGLNKGGDQAAHWRRLSYMALEHGKIGVSIAIVLGVAPLLFVQVIYDPFWFVSNVLSARWAIGFIVLLLVAYWLLWLHYGLVRKAGEASASVFWGWISFALFLAVGFVMHLLTSQMLYPDEWLQWYAPDGVIDASGSGAHAYNPARYAFFILLSLPVTGAWLLGCRQYLAGRAEEDATYIEFLHALGVRLITLGGALAVAALLVWMLTLPAKAAGFAYSPWSVLMAAAVVVLIVLGHKVASGYALAAVSLGVELTAGVLREALRLDILYGVHGYNPLNYTVNMDWYSTLLFFITFAVLGGLALSFMLALAWQSGRTRGVYTASPLIARLADWTLIASLAWVAQYFLFGAWVLLR